MPRGLGLCSYARYIPIKVWNNNNKIYEALNIIIFYTYLPPNLMIFACSWLNFPVLLSFHRSRTISFSFLLVLGRRDDFNTSLMPELTHQIKANVETLLLRGIIIFFFFSLVRNNFTCKYVAVWCVQLIELNDQ